MKILVLGTGGREHSIAWKLKQHHRDVYLHPGNAGTLKVGIPNLGNITSLDEISIHAKNLNIDLIVIGPEALLAQDQASQLRKAGFLVVGPGLEGAQLETSKVFAKKFMARAQVPSAAFRIYLNLEELTQGIQNGSYPKVLKLDGLAAGKGVVIAKNPDEAIEFAHRVWVQKVFGPSPQRIIEEDFIPGVELSYIGLCDGKTFVPLSSSTDFKRVYDEDKGPNTGGMGAVSPSPYLNSELENKIKTRIVAPILKTFVEEKIDFRGVLYIGIMIDRHQNPWVLEFNTRFGDPETQSLMMRMEDDLTPLLLATAKGQLATAAPIRWTDQTAVYVVGAALGYPDKVLTGSPISGWETTSSDVQIFFSSVELKNQTLVTAGGRVLGVGALGNNVEEARTKAYQRLKNIVWEGIHYRKDIGLTR